jgi:hypothetical protein
MPAEGGIPEQKTFHSALAIAKQVAESSPPLNNTTAFFLAISITACGLLWGSNPRFECYNPTHEYH